MARGNRQRPINWPVIIALFVALLLAFFAVGRRDYTHHVLELDAKIRDIVRKNGILDRDIIYEETEKDRIGRSASIKIIRRYEAPAGFDNERFGAELASLLKKLKHFTLSRTSSKKDVFSATVSLKGRKVYELDIFKRPSPAAAYPTAPKAGARIAIVIDDFGYNVNNVDEVSYIRMPMTASVLPHLPFSRAAAENLSAGGIEIILHMPMEPHTDVKLESGTIMADMTKERINQLLDDAIQSVPHIKGVSNHMGSKATEDRAVMKTVFTNLKKRGLYFLDSLVTDDSVCRDVAREVGIRIGSRSIFIDNESDEDYIEKQILQTARLASSTGWAIGIGHDRHNTVKVLKKVMPLLKGRGFRFVYLSELVM